MGKRWTVTCNRMDELQRHNIEWRNPDHKNYKLYDSTYVMFKNYPTVIKLKSGYLWRQTLTGRKHRSTVEGADMVCILLWALGTYVCVSIKLYTLYPSLCVCCISIKQQEHRRHLHMGKSLTSFGWWGRTSSPVETHWLPEGGLFPLLRECPSQVSAEGCSVPPLLGDPLLNSPLP